MREWLLAALSQMSLSDDAFGYVVGRGVQEERAMQMGVVEWSGEHGEAPDPEFHKTFGQRLQRLQQRIVCPIWSPRGRLIGMEARTWQGEKRISQYMLPDASWNPIFIGLTPERMHRIWAGGDVWVVEGLFDMGPMEHIVPASDAVLATLRARVSERHALFLRRFCRGMVHMVYDNDETGRNQTHGYIEEGTGKKRWGALETLNRVGVRCRDVPYRGKDPGVVWDRGGVEALRHSFAGHIRGG
jgi:hypothetical protein